MIKKDYLLLLVYYKGNFKMNHQICGTCHWRISTFFDMCNKICPSFICNKKVGLEDRIHSESGQGAEM